jgi:C4-dicarboxylate transporter DctM subunit
MPGMMPAMNRRPTEAAAVAAVYAFLVAVFVYRDMGPLKERPAWRPAWVRLERSTVASNVPLVAPFATFAGGLAQSVVYLPATLVHREVRHVMIEAGRTTIMLMFIIANAMLFAHVLTTERIPHHITEMIVAAGLEPWSFLIVVNILLLLEVVRAALPWLGILLIFLILVTYVPAISTFLPDLLYGP